MGIAERKEREKQQRKEEIINSAEKVFFNKGFDSATMEEVALEAELSKATIYLYFESKEELYFSIFLRGQKILYSIIEKDLKKVKSTYDKILTLLKSMVKYQEKYPDYFETFFYFLTNKLNIHENDCQSEKQDEVHQVFVNKLVEIVQQGKDEGLIREKVDPQNAIMILGTQLWGFLKIYSIMRPKIEKKFKITKSDFFKDYFDLAINGLTKK